jgi:hypothetical protein
MPKGIQEPGLPSEGSIKRDSKIWSRVPWDLDPRKTALAKPRSNCKLLTQPLVREGTLHKQTRNCLKLIKKGQRGGGKKRKRKEKFVVGPRWVLDTKTDWLTDGQSVVI